MNIAHIDFAAGRIDTVRADLEEARRRNQPGGYPDGAAIVDEMLNRC